jgi:hypothetical protein
MWPGIGAQPPTVDQVLALAQLEATLAVYAVVSGKDAGEW